MRSMGGRLVTALTAGALAALALAPVWLATPPPARATAITVTTTEDVIADDGECSLREAIIAANTNTAVDACPAGQPTFFDEIYLTPGTYRLAIAGTDEDAAATGDLDILESLLIWGDYATWDPQTTVIDGAGLDRVFDIHPGAVVDMESVTVTGGMTDGKGGGIRLVDGALGEGCNYPSWTLGLNTVIVRGNQATTGGGMSAGACTWLLASWGVAIIDNEATEDGGGIAVQEGAAFSFYTGVISGNVAGAHGGGVWAQDGFGGVLSGSQSPDDKGVLSFSDIVDNRAETGGGVYIESEGTYSYMPYNITFANGGGNCWVEGADGGCDRPDPLLYPRDASPVGYRLQPGSWAIDAGSAEGALCGFYGDAYGNARPLDGDGDGVAECDFGMYEFPAAPVASASPPAGSGRGSVPNTAVRDSAPDRDVMVWLVGIGLVSWAVLIAGRRGPTRARRGSRL